MKATLRWFLKIDFGTALSERIRINISPPSSLHVGVRGPGWNHCKRAAESSWPFQQRKPCVLCRWQLYQPPETPERVASLSSPFTSTDLARCHKSCWYHIRILTFQAVLGWERLIHLCTHPKACTGKMPGCRTSWRYHPCPFASWITALWPCVSTFQATEAGWMSIHFYQPHPSQQSWSQSETETLGGS